MGLDQQILMQERDMIEDSYKPILMKRKCYPLHSFINKWLQDTYGFGLHVWKSSPFGPYVCLPFEVIERFCTALLKRNKGGGYKIYQIWSGSQVDAWSEPKRRKLKVPLSCSKTIPELVRHKLEEQLDPDLLKLLGSYVGGQCKYERMFGDLDQDAWDLYPKKEQEKDVELLWEAIDSGIFDTERMYYYASW
jgi:hypothetical protein